MNEMLYVSTAKLARWPVRSGRLGRVQEVDAKLIKVGFAAAEQEEWAPRKVQARLDRICKKIDQSRGFTRWLDGSQRPDASWFTFDTYLRWGKIGRGVENGPKEKLRNTVFFGGPAPSSNPVVDLLLGGWAGHLVGNHGAHDPSGRIGSGLDDFFEIWDEVSQDEQNGIFSIRAAFARLRRVPGEVSGVPYRERLFRTAYNTFSHALIHGSPVPLRGYAQVLASLPADEHHRAMIIGTPLFVELKHGEDD